MSLDTGLIDWVEEAMAPLARVSFRRTTCWTMPMRCASGPSWRSRPDGARR